MHRTKRLTAAARQVVGMLALTLLATMLPTAAQAWELIPSLGVTKSTDDNAADAKGFGGLAVRVPLLPNLKAEGAIGYRQDSFADGNVKVRQWPITASLWLAPLPAVYIGGGLGWYHTTLDFAETLPIEDATNMDMGVHLGGGVGMPIGPNLGLDLNGRYVFMQSDNDNLQLPTTFDPDFWSVSLGLVFTL